MLGVALFVAFWVVLALVLFFIAVRGGVRGARATLQAQSRAASRAMTALFIFIFVAFGIVLPGVFLVGNHQNANAQIGGIKLSADAKAGRELFGRYCNVCHTLAGANAVGKVGPNLDQLRPSKELVLHTLANGCLQNPPSPSSAQACLGQGTMPADILEGKQATEVAEFVSEVAGKE